MGNVGTDETTDDGTSDLPDESLSGSETSPSETSNGTTDATSSGPSTSGGTSTSSTSSTTEPTTETSPTSNDPTLEPTDGSGTTSADETTTGAEPCVIDNDCDDGNFCNGPEACDPDVSLNSSGCTPGTPACGANAYCAEDREECITARRIFISSETYQGDLGGAAGADTICQGLAAKASLPGQWRAYLIDSNNGLDRHTQLPVRYERIDGVTIADNWVDLSDESIQNPIERDENGASAGGNVWTGLINVGGSGNGNNDCSDWTSNTGGCGSSSFVCGGAGESNMINDHWDGFHIFQCSDQYRLYCVEQ